MKNKITEATRRSIFDYFTASGTPWSGRLAQNDFLARLYDLTSLPSFDHRFKSAVGDIRTHTYNFDDWDPDWILFDSRFRLLDVPDDEFITFLAQTVHPVVRQEPEEAAGIVVEINKRLSQDGWELVPSDEMSGFKIYSGRKIGQELRVYDQPIGWEHVDRQIQSAQFLLERAENVEEFQSIGLICRELLISTAQAVYDKEKHKSTEGKELSKSDSKRMLDAFIVGELVGPGKKEARALVRAAVNLANQLQHQRTASYQQAALCTEATFSVINIVAILSGRRR